MKFKNLQAVNYYNGEYELEFNLDGGLKHVTVDASDHPEAATDEDYFDKLNFNKITFTLAKDFQ